VETVGIVVVGIVVEETVVVVARVLQDENLQRKHVVVGC